LVRSGHSDFPLEFQGARHVCGSIIFQIRNAHFSTLPDLRQGNEANICHPDLQQHDLRLRVQRRWRPHQLAAWSSKQVVHDAPRRTKETDHDLMCMVSRDFWETNFFNDVQYLRLSRLGPPATSTIWSLSEGKWTLIKLHFSMSAFERIADIQICGYHVR
jgi:hypothetical protein